MPKVSIIVPVHNTEKYLQACVESLTAQTLADIEIILVENCSTDNSLALCHKLATTDDRIKVVSIDKADLSTARNEGIKVATGEYMGFVDSDDTVLPEMYGDMYNLAISNNLGVVCVNLHRVYDDRENKYLFPESGEVKILSAKELTTLNLRCKIAISACTTIIRRDLFAHLTFPQNMYYEDRASTYLFTANCGRGAWIDKSYYCYYYRTGSICRTQSYKKYRDFALSNLLRLEFINNSGLYSAEEMAEVAQESADSFLRKLRHILSIKSTSEDREEALSWCRKIDLIPHGTRLPLKARLIRWYIRKFVI